MKFTYQLVEDILSIIFEGNLMELLRTDSLMQVIEQHLQQNILKCAIDLSALKFINSTGISTLIVILTKFRNKGGEVILINPSEHIQKLLIMTKLQAMFQIAPTLQEGKNLLAEN